MYLHSMFSVVFADFSVLLSFEALHSNVFLLSSLFPIILYLLVLVTNLESRYQAIAGSGNASLFALHWTSLWIPSLIVNGLALGIKVTFLTPTANKYDMSISRFLIFFFYLNEVNQRINTHYIDIYQSMKQLLIHHYHIYNTWLLYFL